jgi:aspartate/methionine/tyrosine aminotransferase
VAPSFATVAAERDHLVVVNGFSKAYNMTGWRLGYGLAGERLISLMTKAAEFMTSSPPAMVQQAGITALRDGEAYIEQIRDLYSHRRNFVMEQLGRIPRVSLPRPDGGFYAFLEVEGLDDSATFAQRLVDETGVALAPGAAFGPGGEGYLRLCFASSEEILKAVLARFDEFMRRTETDL